MKICLKCNKEKAKIEFYKNKSKPDGLNDWCKQCYTTYEMLHYTKYSEKYKIRVKNYKSNIRNFVLDFKKRSKCMKCGDSRWYVLDFHHRDSKTKEINIGEAVRFGWSIKRIKTEIEKCDIICSNCHRELQYLEGLITQ